MCVGREVKRNMKIVYLCSEYNAKSCLGLHGLVDDGWGVGLVIAYKSKKNFRLIGSIFRIITKFLHLLERFLFGGNKVKLLPYDSCRDICDSMGISYILTTDHTLSNVIEDIRSFSPDVILSNGWSFKIDSIVFELSKIVSLNCHSSYLPDYRGGNITYAPLINCEVESGVTVHVLDKKFDNGLILAQCRVSIDQFETAASLNAKRAMVTPGDLIEALVKAGDESLYKVNPKSPFYFRCSYERYMFLRVVNLIYKKIGCSHIKYYPKCRDDL